MNKTTRKVANIPIMGEVAQIVNSRELVINRGKKMTWRLD